MSPPFKVKAVYEYTSPHEDDLHFPNGQIITVTEEEDDDWYSGEYVDASGAKQEGIFPRNFVEKYEPTAPPRPVRASRPRKDAEGNAPVAAELPAAVPEPAPEPEELEAEVLPPPVAREPSPSPPAASKPAEASPPTAPKPVQSSSRSVPPPVTDKPSGGSFRDRIAAFNKAAPPVAPFKPPGLSSGGANSFIKKPFVAPPPSKNAYVPPPREAPVAKVYRRDEDPEITAREAENQEQAEKAGLAASSTDADAEEQPKPTSLKERIALLQKQQAEQAARHAEAVQKKEKPKRPAKKRTESYSTQEGAEEADEAALEKQATGESAPKASMDSVREEPDAPRRRKSSKEVVAVPGIPPRMPVTDGNEADMSGAGYTTEEPEEIHTARGEGDEKPAIRGPPPRTPTAPARQPDVGEEEGTADEPSSKAEEDDEEDEEEEEEDDVDPEVRRREELRARMAKMSGGMGMHGMFGPAGGMPMPGMVPPKKKKTASSSETWSSGQAAEDAPAARAPPVPMIPLPGLSKVRSPSEADRQLGDDDEQTPIARSRPSAEVQNAEEVLPERSAPPVPGGRPAPPAVPKESRPVPPPPALIPNTSAGSETDDEMSESTQNLSLATPTAEAPRPPARPSEAPGSPPPPPRRASTFSSEQSGPISPPQPGGNKEKRASRVPPIPGASLSSPAPVPQTRAPPPPPPGGHMSRPSTSESRGAPPTLPPQPPSDEEEVTEYDGDYDTDIASAVPHRDALKAHARDDSFDDISTGRAPVGSPPAGPPPIPSAPAPRGVPPPLPSQPPPGRASADVPRAAPPPPPSKAPAPWEEDDNEYDPFRYSVPGAAAVYGAPAPKPAAREDDLYSSSPPRTFASPPGPPQDRAVPPPPPPREHAPPSAPPRAPPRQSLDVNRGPPPRRSTDLSRMSMDSGFVANDVDLGRNTFWWTQPKTLPPPFQNRKDILCEAEESTSSAADGKPTVIKDIYVLFQDYSQTTIRAQFNAQDPADVTLEQKHEPPPSRLRQDQLEEAHAQFGRHIYEAVTAKKETVVGDGTPHGLIQELLRPLADALPPVGTRAYGAVVYGNLANASTQQNDEIRAGDILTLRNAKFQGKHGAMHAKYSMEVGKPDHVAVVAEWDGTKKKVRAWEQGRESRKVKLESYKLDDLRSGEVKIWRVMPRSWIGWAGHHH